MAASPSPPTQPPLGWHAIDQRFTTPLLATAASDDEILWSAGPDAPGNYAPDLYRYAVATGDVQRIVRSENRKSNLLPIAGSRSGYAYVEGSADGNQVITWKLWFLPPDAGANPVLIDEMDNRDRPTPSPTIAIGDRWLVWASVHEREGRAVSELAVLDLVSMGAGVIESTPAARATYWFPSLDGDRLVYNKLVTAPAISSEVYLIDDLAADREPRRLDINGDAAMPGVTGDWVVWKQNATNAFDWGSLVRYSIASGDITPIQLGDEPEVNSPSVGSHYVAAWELESTTLYVYDLSADQPIVIEALPPDSEEGNVRPFIHDRLLTWVHVLPGDKLELRWTRLPE